MKPKLKFNEINDEQIREIMERQVFLENFADPDYDAYFKKQTFTDWWGEQLWSKLSFEIGGDDGQVSGMESSD